jgi:hypothetical protein
MGHDLAPGSRRFWVVVTASAVSTVRSRVTVVLGQVDERYSTMTDG